MFRTVLTVHTVPWKMLVKWPVAFYLKKISVDYRQFFRKKNSINLQQMDRVSVLFLVIAWLPWLQGNKTRLNIFINLTSFGRVPHLNCWNFGLQRYFGFHKCLLIQLPVSNNVFGYFLFLSTRKIVTQRNPVVRWLGFFFFNFLIKNLNIL